MALCILGKRIEFSPQYAQFFLAGGYFSDELTARVERLLGEVRSELVWIPYTSEMGVGHTSLRAARAENNLDEIAALMKSLWQKAISED